MAGTRVTAGAIKLPREARVGAFSCQQEQLGAKNGAFNEKALKYFAGEPPKARFIAGRGMNGAALGSFQFINTLKWVSGPCGCDTVPLKEAPFLKSCGHDQFLTACFASCCWACPPVRLQSY